jgi:transcription elongation factor GreA-like protein
MTSISKFDLLMNDITTESLKDNVDSIIGRIAEVLEEEQMGSMDDMMTELRDYLQAKEKLEEYLDDDGMMQIPVETVFSWFKASVEKKRSGLR